MSEKLTEAQLLEIKKLNFIPEGYLKGYLNGKDWSFVDREFNQTKDDSNFNYK